jgi:hypothetical protein
MISSTTFKPANLQSHDDDPSWKVKRLPFADGAGGNLANMQAGFLVKLNATQDGVVGALAADDAALDGVIVDVGDPVGNPPDTTVAVAFMGSFDKRTVKYANGASPLSAAAIVRLRDVGIFVDDTVPGGAFAP